MRSETRKVNLLLSLLGLGLAAGLAQAETTAMLGSQGARSIHCAVESVRAARLAHVRASADSVPSSTGFLSNRANIMTCVTRSTGTQNVGMNQAAPR